MKVSSPVVRSLLVCVPALLAAQGPAPSPLLQVRLTSHLTSDSTPQGTRFRATVIAPLESGGEIVIPQGSIVEGHVTRARHLRLGLLRERAALELAFDHYQLPDGRQFPLKAQLRAVDNAREDVLPNGRIRGILAADAPSKLTQGFWFTPNPTLLHRSISGLSGLGGLISTKTPLGLPGGLALLGLRLAILKTPDPEIHLPPSTDLKLAVSELPGDAPSFGAAPTPLPLPEDFAEWLTKQPYRIHKAPKKRAADIINFAFVGSRSQLDQAFKAAGWNTTDPLTRRTFGRTYKAFTMMRAYPTAPVSTLYYGNRAPDVVYQRSLNTLSKRHHIRVWSPLEDQAPEREVWLGAATHDVGIGFEAKRMSFNHRIDADIDVERAKIIADLNFAGCLRSVSFLDRPPLSENARKPRKSGIITDGKVAVLNLTDCQPQPLVAVAAPKPRGNAFSRTARRLALETRHHLLRGNVYFLGFRGLAWWFNTAAARNPGIQE